MAGGQAGGGIKPLMIHHTYSSFFTVSNLQYLVYHKCKFCCIAEATKSATTPTASAAPNPDDSR